MHLMLKFTAEHGTIENERMELVFMDTETGQVIEMNIDAKMVEMLERAPKWGETDSASRLLGKPQAGMISKTDADELQQRLSAAEALKEILQARVEDRDEKILTLERQVLKLQNDQNKYNQGEILAEALDSYIISKADRQDFERFEAAKKVFQRITGKKWVDDGLDDEEGDL